MSNEIFIGDALAVLKTLPDQSWNTCVTSPPYFRLRDYGTGTWSGGDDSCDHVEKTCAPYEGLAEWSKNNARGGGHKVGQIAKMSFRGECGKCGAICEDLQMGSEDTPEEFVANMVEVFREVRRVLRDDGTLWLNIGDSYAGTGGFGKQSGEGFKNKARGKEMITKAARFVGGGIKTKDLIGIPWMLAFALRADGWYLRQDIIWSKPNPMPESCTDRCTKAHEYIFLLSKQQTYYYDADAIRTPLTAKTLTTFDTVPKSKGNDMGGNVKSDNWANSVAVRKPKMKKPDGWDTAPGAHSTIHRKGRQKGEYHEVEPDKYAGANKRSVWNVATQAYPDAHFATFPPELISPCILAGSPEGGVVGDPFGGAGTTGLVALRANRQFQLIELNPQYAKMARKRLNPLLKQHSLL